MGPGTLVSPGNNAARRGALVAPSAIPCSLFHLISRIHLSLFSETGVLPRHARCVLSRLRCTHPSVKFLSRQDWQNRESFLQRLWTLVPGHLSSHSALSSYRLFAPLALWRLSLSPFTMSGPGLVELLGFWGSMVFCHAPIPRNRSITTTTNVKRALPRLNHPTLQCRSTSCYALSIFSSKDQNCLCVVAECATRKLSIFVTVGITS